MWASTLSISNAQEAGLLLLADSAATTANPSVYELKNLSGAGGFNSNQPPFGENRLVRVTQSVSTVWGGTFDARTRQDNVVGLSVAGADGVDSKTLVLTGHNSCTNALTVEASGSVRLEGTWVGDVSVSGEFGGNGRQTDGLVTFASGASLSVDVGAGGLHLAGMDSWPSSIVVSGFADPASVRRVALLTSDRPLPPGFENVALTVDEGLQGDWRVVKEERALCLRRNIGLMLLLR